MTRELFLEQLQIALTDAKIEHVDSLVEYYNEMICDRIEDGMEEQDAIAALGSIDEIIKEMILEKPIGTLVKDTVTKSHHTAKESGKNTLWMVFIILGSPLWIPLLLTLLIILGVIYMIPWIMIMTFFIILASFGISALAGIISFVNCLISMDIGTALVSLGVALILGSLSVFLVKPVLWLTKQTLQLGASVIRSIKKRIIQ